MKARFIFLALAALSIAFGYDHSLGQPMPQADLIQPNTPETNLRSTFARDFNSNGEFDDVSLDDARSLVVQMAQSLKDPQDRLERLENDFESIGDRFVVARESLDDTQAEIRAAYLAKGIQLEDMNLVLAPGYAGPAARFVDRYRDLTNQVAAVLLEIETLEHAYLMIENEALYYESAIDELFALHPELFDDASLIESLGEYVPRRTLPSPPLEMRTCWDGSVVSQGEFCPPSPVGDVDEDDSWMTEEEDGGGDGGVAQPLIEEVVINGGGMGFRRSPDVTCRRRDGGDLACDRQVLTECQLDLLASDQMVLTCETNRLELVQSKISIEQDVSTTVRQVVAELEDEAFGYGPYLCLWNIPFTAVNAEEETSVQVCNDPGDRFSAAFAAHMAGNTFPAEGRIGYHSPKEMVTNQPYLLELAITPKFENESESVAEARISEVVGPGTIDPDAAPLDLVFTGTDISELMAAELIGPGLEIFPVTDVEQLVVPDEATVWQWQVTATEPGAKLLNFSVSQVIERNGQAQRRSVKRLPVMVKTVTIESMLTAPRSAPAQVVSDPGPEQASFAGTPQSGASGEPRCRDSETGLDARRALLITNADYVSPVSALSETYNDGNRMFDSLNVAGFKVRHCRDLSREETISEMRALGRHLKPLTDTGEETLAVFYYSGHGANLDGDNYILPVDLEGASPYDIEDGGVSFEDIFNRLSTQVSRSSIVIFDACRTVMDDQSRGLVRGYSPVGWPVGSLLQAFAAAPGQTAPDSGLYSSVLAEQIANSEASAGQVFSTVQREVFNRSARTQRPTYTDQTYEELYFRPQSTD